MVNIRLLEKTDAGKVGDIVNMTKKGGKHYVESEMGEYAEVTKETLKKETKEGLAEEQARIDAMKSPTLLADIIKEIQKSGVVGEEESMLKLILRISLRLVDDARHESSNIIVSDLSGGGKDYIVGKICEVLLSKKDYFHRTGLTEKIFTYWHTDKKSQKAGYTWDGKILHIEDPDEKLLSSSGFKTMASGGSEHTVVKDQKAVDLKVLGKPVMIITSLNAKIDEEGRRRWDGISIDTSETQSNLINQKNMNTRKRKDGIEENKALRTGLENLKRGLVYIPYTELIEKVFTKKIITRTLSTTFCDYICASAMLHQYQRQRATIKDVEYVVANWFDYDYAKYVFCGSSTNEGIMLNKIEKDFLGVLEKNGREMSISEIATEFSRGKNWIYDNVDRIKGLGVIGETNTFDMNANKEVRKFYNITYGVTLSNIKDSSGFPRFSDWFSDYRISILSIDESRFFGFFGFLVIVRLLIKDEGKLQSFIKDLTHSKKPKKPKNLPRSESNNQQKTTRKPKLENGQERIDEEISHGND